MKIYRPKTSVIFNDSIKKIRKVSIGERNLDCPEKVVMLVGATGSGKSTLINVIFNYIVGVKWEDDFRLKLISVETPYGQKESQTDYITSYVIYHNSHSNVPFTITIIDTPGFGNTAGIERDKEIVDQMRTFFNVGGENGIDKIDAVGFVFQSALPRLTPSQRYIFDYILSLFGKDIGDNIIMLLTFADGQKPQILTDFKEAQIPYKKYFRFNNSTLYNSNKYELDEDADEDGMKNFHTFCWDMGIKSLNSFIVELGKLQPKSVIQTKEILDRRIHLETTIKDLEKNIDSGNAIIHRLVNLETDRKYQNQAHQVDRLVKKNVNKFGATYIKILAFTEDARQTMQTLELLALRGRERIQQFEWTQSEAVLMQQIADKTFDPFSKAREGNKSGVWTNVAKYLKPRFGNAFYIDMELYRLAVHEPGMELFSKSQASSNPTSSLKECETTKLHARSPSFGQNVRAVSSDQNATAASSRQNVSMNKLALHFFKCFLMFTKWFTFNLIKSITLII